MKIGDLLLPNSYQIANGKPVSGVIIDVVDDLWGLSYKVLLSNGIQHWLDDDRIRGLFEVVEENEEG